MKIKTSRFVLRKKDTAPGGAVSGFTLEVGSAGRPTPIDLCFAFREFFYSVTMNCFTILKPLEEIRT